MVRIAPIWVNKNIGTIIDVIIMEDKIAMLTNNGVKLYSREDGTIVDNIGKEVGGFEIVEISANYFALYLRNSIGNVYMYTPGRTLFYDSNVIKMIGSTMVKFDGLYAYSTTEQRLVPIFKGNYINIYDNGVKQKVDGTWEGVEDIDDKVVKIEGGHYLNVNGELKTIQGELVATGVEGFGELKYSRDKVPETIFYGNADTPYQPLTDYINEHKVEINNVGVSSGRVTGVTSFSFIPRYKISPDTNHPAVRGSGIWYQKNGSLFVKDSSLQFKAYGDTFNYDYWFENECENDIFIGSGAFGSLYFDNDLIISKSSPEYRKIDA